MINHQLHVLLFILIGHRNVSAIWNEVNDLRLAEGLRLDGEGLSNDIRNVVLKHPDKRLIVVQVKSFHVFDADGLA